MPLAVTYLEREPRSPLVFLQVNNSRFRSNNSLPGVAYLHRTSVVIIAEPPFVQACQERSVTAKGSSAPRKSIFSEIYGELKEATKLSEEFASSTNNTSRLSSKLTLLDAPSHLIPAVNILFSSFMGSLLTPSTKDELLLEAPGASTADVEMAEIPANDEEDLDTEESLASELHPQFDLLQSSSYSNLASLFKSIQLDA